MNKQSVAITLTIFVVLLCGHKLVSSEPTPLKLPNSYALDEYIAQPEPYYNWTLFKVVQYSGYSAHWLNFTSLKWLNDKEVSHSIWKHSLIISIPDDLDRTINQALIYITGGGIDPASGIPQVPSSPDPYFPPIAVTTRTIGAELHQIPYDPLRFTGETFYRGEDNLIAKTWKMFLLNSSDPTILLRFPMVKASHLAMQAIQEYVSIHIQHQIKKFVVAGASKRGWTTWLVGATDPTHSRVNAIAPIVIDIPNVVVNVNHQWETYGFWTFAFVPYIKENITQYLNTPEFANMMTYVDPYFFFNRTRISSIPKYIICASGDEFFLPDDSHFYYAELPGEKYIRYVPNAEHSLAGSAIDVAESLQTFYLDILRRETQHVPSVLPQITYTYHQNSSGGYIFANASSVPQSSGLRITQWVAHNYATRDFRFIPTFILWFPYDIDMSGGENGIYTAKADLPDFGYRAHFMEMSVYPQPFGNVMKTTSLVQIVPNVEPFAKCGYCCQCRDQCDTTQCGGIGLAEKFTPEEVEVMRQKFVDAHKSK